MWSSFKTGNSSPCIPWKIPEWAECPHQPMWQNTYLAGNKKLHEHPGPAVEKCVFMGMCRLACGCHGNETVTSWVTGTGCSGKQVSQHPWRTWVCFLHENRREGYRVALVLYGCTTHFPCIRGNSLMCLFGPGSPASFHIVRIISKPPNTMEWLTEGSFPPSDQGKFMILQGTVSLVYVSQEPMGKAHSYIYRPGKYVNMETDWNISVLLQNCFNIDGY